MALWCYVLMPALCCLPWWGMYRAAVQEECEQLWHRLAAPWIGGPMPQNMQQIGYGAITIYGEEELSRSILKTFSMEPSAELPRKCDIDFLPHLPTAPPTAAYISPFMIRLDSYPYGGQPTLLRYGDGHWVYYLSRPLFHSQLTELPPSAELQAQAVTRHRFRNGGWLIIVLILLPALLGSLPLLWGARLSRYTGTIGRRLTLYGGPIFFWVLQGFLFHDMTCHLGFGSSSFVTLPSIAINMFAVTALWVAETGRKRLFCNYLWHPTSAEIAAREQFESKQAALRQALFLGSQTTIHKQREKKNSCPERGKHRH